MNKIKVIDLLNMISKGEEVPKKILYKYKHLEYDEEYYLTYDRHYECYYDEEGRPIPSLLADNLWNLNDEVEIIEEEKKIPEKLGLINYSEDQATLLIHHKVDEIIDYLVYLKSKGE